MNNLDKAGIYIITNNINNKKYVGKAKRKIKYRWKDHCKNAIYLNLDTYLYRAIRKYGKENFTIEILDEEYTYGSNGYRVKNWREYKAQEIIIYNPTLVNTRMEPTITKNSFEVDDEVVF